MHCASQHDDPRGQGCASLHPGTQVLAEQMLPAGQCECRGMTRSSGASSCRSARVERRRVPRSPRTRRRHGSRSYSARSARRSTRPLSSARRCQGDTARSAGWSVSHAGPPGARRAVGVRGARRRSGVDRGLDDVGRVRGIRDVAHIAHVERVRSHRGRRARRTGLQRLRRRARRARGGRSRRRRVGWGWRPGCRSTRPAARASTRRERGGSASTRDATPSRGWRGRARPSLA